MFPLTRMNLIAKPDLAPSERRLCRRNRSWGEAGRSAPTGARRPSEGGRSPPPRSQFPVLVPGCVGPHALARDGHVEQIWAVLLRHALQPPALRRLQLRGLRGGLA